MTKPAIEIQSVTEVLLLDEPLSALGLKLREEMRNELKELQMITGVTTSKIRGDGFDLRTGCTGFLC
jgi:ABC-type Fe3+/spermidine/putrescine transport system ATPase subunit